MKYSYTFFKNGLPEWKRTKDPILVKIFYRPVSFYLASLAANLHISANTIFEIRKIAKAVTPI